MIRRTRLEIVGEEGHFSNIANIQPVHVPFTYVFIGLSKFMDMYACMNSFFNLASI